MRGPLSDRKIEQYRKRGWYAEDFREARRDLMARKKAKQLKRDGSFLIMDGRMVYSP